MLHRINPTYAGLMFVATLTGAWLWHRQSAPSHLSPKQRWALGLAAFLGAFVGGKLPFALADGPGLWTGVAWWSDGKTILTGFAGGYCCVEYTKWLLGIRTKTGDTFAVPVAVAVGLGRIGCWVAGCCYGSPTELPWGTVFPLAADATPTPRHPTQLYETLFHFTLAYLLYQASRRQWLRNQRFKAYLIAYCVYRFATEYIRPEPRVAIGFTSYQWTALLLMVVMIWLWQRDRQELARTRALSSQ